MRTPSSSLHQQLQVGSLPSSHSMRVPSGWSTIHAIRALWQVPGKAPTRAIAALHALVRASANTRATASVHEQHIAAQLALAAACCASWRPATLPLAASRLAWQLSSQAERLQVPASVMLGLAGAVASAGAATAFMQGASTAAAAPGQPTSSSTPAWPPDMAAWAWSAGAAGCQSTPLTTFVPEQPSRVAQQVRETVMRASQAYASSISFSSNGGGEAGHAAGLAIEAAAWAARAWNSPKPRTLACPVQLACSAWLQLRHTTAQLSAMQQHAASSSPATPDASTAAVSAAITASTAAITSIPRLEHTCCDQTKLVRTQLQPHLLSVLHAAALAALHIPHTECLQHELQALLDAVCSTAGPDWAHSPAQHLPAAQLAWAVAAHAAQLRPSPELNAELARHTWHACVPAWLRYAQGEPRAVAPAWRAWLRTLAVLCPVPAAAATALSQHARTEPCACMLHMAPGSRLAQESAWGVWAVWDGVCAAAPPAPPPWSAVPALESPPQASQPPPSAGATVEMPPTTTPRSRWASLEDLLGIPSSSPDK